ncbi:hypothetical protein CsSME_00051086 [Camellia sinensis var. sinensis]
MENQHRLKLRISRMLRSSFGSCKSRNISDDIERPIFVPHQHHQLIELFSPKSSETEICSRLKVSDRNSLLTPPNTFSRNFPPTSPISPLNSLFEFQRSESIQNQKKPRKKKKKTTHLIKKVSFESFDNYYDWLSSEDDESDDDETTLFSSKSLSSGSSGSFRRNKARYRRRRAGKETETGMGLNVVPLKGKVKDSFAVVKRSSDPYSDFRTSMVEMIVEKQIFGGRDLENLLQTFLCLNSYHHHRVIIQVFNEIWEALFSNCC